MIEVERLYLAAFIPTDLAQCLWEEMCDLYLPKDVDHAHLRLRKRTTKSSATYELTKKEVVEQGEASARYEYTIPLNEHEYTCLSTLPGKKLHKMRYFYPYHNHTAEISIFHGALRGLVLIDVEFDSVKEKNAFVKPPFALAEVTQESFAAGGVLAGKSYGDIEADLKRYGYKPLTIS